MALMPPVSAIRGTMGPSLPASERWMSLATCVEPVKATPAQRSSLTSAAPTVSPGPCSTASASRGTPASCSSSTMRTATAGVCSAGLASTALPATRAAATWPVKIASGKFQGLMQTNTPRPRRRSSLDSPVGPGRARGAMPVSACVGVVAAEVDGLAHLGHAVRQGLVRFVDEQRAELGQATLQRIGGPAQHRRALRERRAFPSGKAGVQALHRGLHLGGLRLGHDR